MHQSHITAGFLALAGSALVCAPVHAQISQHVFTSITQSAQIGQAVAAAHDVNADGIDDILLGAPADSVNGYASGSAFVYSGKDWSLLRVLHGGTTLEQFGRSVAGPGDVNGDGFADLAVAAPYDSSVAAQAGAVRVYSGKTGVLIYALTGSAAGLNFGLSIAAAGDVNLDGIPDMVIGAPGYDGVLGLTPDAGRVIVVSGNTGATLLTFVGKKGDRLGSVVAGAGDVDGDGRDDVAMGAPGEAILGAATGRIDVRSGNGGALLYQRFGPHAASFFGTALDGVGDVDGDGFADLLVGASGESGAAGAAHVYRGPSGAASWIFVGDAPDDRFGTAVSAAGDVDKDGHADLLVGTFPPNGGKLPYVRVLSGATGLPLYGSPTGPNISGFGSALAAAGDVTGDGWPDVLVGAPYAIVGATQGQVTVYSPLWCQADLGSGGPGLAHLSMCGAPLGAAGQADIVLQGAAVSRPALLAASLQASAKAFKGGVIVPNLASGVTFVLATDTHGAMHLVGIPGGLGLFDVFLQVVIQDPAQAKGFALSNVVLAHFLN